MPPPRRQPTIDPADATSDTAPSAQKSIDGATVDLGRASRCGFGEAIFGEGKSADLIVRIAETQLDDGQDVLVTRIDTETAHRVRPSFQHAQHNPVARTMRISNHPFGEARPMDENAIDSEIHAAVVTAGSTDEPVAAEAMETLAWMGVPYQSFTDIGVAGPQRLLAAGVRRRRA